MAIDTQRMIVVERRGVVSHPPGHARARPRQGFRPFLCGQDMSCSDDRGIRPAPRDKDNLPLQRPSPRGETRGPSLSCAFVIVSFRHGTAETYEAGNPPVKWIFGTPPRYHARAHALLTADRAALDGRRHVPVCCDHPSIGFLPSTGGLEHPLMFIEE
jgi:hypothetical protein